MDSFAARGTLQVGDDRYQIYRLSAVPGTARLPYCLKVLAENLMRCEDGVTVLADQMRALARWEPRAQPVTEVQFTPARVVLQDFTGVPCVVDLATMRDAMARLGGDVTRINPLTPVQLVIDHSLQVDVAGVPDARERNVALEYQRNAERYQFLRWGQKALANFAVVPPGTGIVHQVNIEYLASVIQVSEGDGLPVAFPDTCVGTDSHTTMANGLGVLGWGVGGIEAEAAMLGRPLSMLIPQVVGCRLVGQTGPGVTATDVVLTLTQLLRRHGVVGKFVEFYGTGVARLPVADRVTISNMSPEFGSTAAVFPIDAETIAYLRLTGRSEQQLALVEAYARVQGMWHDPTAPGYQPPEFSEGLELDLATVVPSLAGPRRPQDRIDLIGAKQTFALDLAKHLPVEHPTASPATADLPEEETIDAADAAGFPASDPLAAEEPLAVGEPHLANEPQTTNEHHLADIPQTTNQPPLPSAATIGASPRQAARYRNLTHGDVVIAAITSCTNTSNPSVMLAAGLLARNAVARGLRAQPWVKTSMAPGSQVVNDYFRRAGLWPALEALGFHLVGYGCATCIGNSGPLASQVSAAIQEGDLAVAAVLSGNRNFEGRISPDVKLNYLASPPLVVAYALAGTMDFDFEREPLGLDQDGVEVFLRDLWPTEAEVAATVINSIDQKMYRDNYASVFQGDARWQHLEAPPGQTFDWSPTSTYVRRPPYFDGMAREPEPVRDLQGARVLAWLGDSVTTDHISPAGTIQVDSPAGQYLAAHGVTPTHFNSYGSRRGNHEVMIRGTFANIRLRNLLLAGGVEGGFTRCFLTGEITTMYDAAQKYAAAGVPLVVLGGAEYGCGSSRDWAAKGTALLGVRAVIAQSFERIHRSNLIGMGVLPLEFPAGCGATSLGLDGTELYDVSGIADLNQGVIPRMVTVTATKTSAVGRCGTTDYGSDEVRRVQFEARVRIDTPGEADYYRHGGILQFVLRGLLDQPPPAGGPSQGSTRP